MIVYKYRDCGSGTWDLIRICKLFFAEPSWLNDPLDSSIDIAAEYEVAKRLIRDRDKTQDARKSFLMFLLDGSHQFRNPTSGGSMSLNIALQHFLNQIGILSLSKSPNDALLWSHYANGHRGICLAFDSEILKIEGVFIGDDVKYLGKPPYVELFLQMVDELSEFVRPWDNYHHPPEQGDAFYTNQLSRLMKANLFVKSVKWQYEQEYRLVSSKSGLHEFPPQALREVIRGTKISEPDKKTLANILDDPLYSHVVVKDVVAIQGSFDFEVLDARP